MLTNISYRALRILEGGRISEAWRCAMGDHESRVTCSIQFLDMCEELLGLFQQRSVVPESPVPAAARYHDNSIAIRCGRRVHIHQKREPRVRGKHYVVLSRLLCRQRPREQERNTQQA